MGRLRGFPRRFRFPWRTAPQVEREVDAELEFHLAMRAEELERGGLSPEEARREAMRGFGDLEATRRQLAASGRHGERRLRWQTMIEDCWRDVRYGARSLAKAPGFTALAIMVLAVGLGANSTTFTLANVLLLRPVSIANPHDVVGIFERSGEGSWPGFSYPEYADIRDLNRSFSDVAAFTIDYVGLTNGDSTRRVMAGFVSANYFRTFGVPVAQGRDFSLAEEGSGAEATVAVVSHGYWLRHGGRPDLLGSILRVNGNPVQVVGIAAAGFTGHTAVYSPEIWLPLGLLERVGNDFGNGGPRPRLEDRENRGWLALLIGRIDAHRSKAEAAADLETLAARLEAQHPPASGTHPTYVIGPLSRFGVSTGPEDDAGVVNLTVLLVGMSSILLLVACINLANMFLARGAGRRSEMAIRRALGGGRMRLVRQLLIEGSILALAGGAAGLFLAYWAARWLASSVAAVPAADLGASIAALDLRPDLFVLGATLAACVLATLLFGLGPAWRISGDVAAALNEHAGGPGAFATRRFRIARIPFAPRNLLIVLQVSLSLALLTAGGLFLRSAFEAGKAKPGFDIDPIALAEIDPSLLGYDEARSREIYRQALERVRAMPGVETASLASLVAYGGLSNGRTVQRRDSETPAKFSAQYVIIGDHYFDTLGLPMMRGRGFTRAEASFATAHPVAIVDEPLAKRLFGNAAGAVGRYVVLSSRVPAAEATAMEIVGVAPGLRNGFSEQPSPHVYVPFGQHYAPAMHLEVRAADTVDADSLLEAIRRELLAIDAAMPVLSMKTMTDQRDGSVAMTLMRAGGQVFAVLGGLALLLAVVGVYGVKAFLVARRTREIGLRMALGAGPGDVKRQILREGVGLTVAGLVIGLWLAVAVGRVLSGMLYGIDAVDPVVLAAVAALLATAALTAAYVPARRATRIDPMNALRHD